MIQATVLRCSEIGADFCACVMRCSRILAKSHVKLYCRPIDTST